MKDGNTSTISLRDYQPLIVVFFFITLGTAVLSYLYPDVTTMRTLMFFEGLMLAVFGLFKLIDVRGFQEGFSTYDLIARRVPVWGYLYPFLEVGLGALLILNMFIVPVASVVAAISLVGIASVYSSMRSGSKVSCACLGTALKVPLTNVSLAENVVMVALAVAMLVMNSTNHVPGSVVQDQSQSMRVTSDREFIEGMIPHHEEAVVTAKVILERGTNPDLTALAQTIVEAQEREIATMKTWYQNWYGKPYENTGQYVPMMRSQAGLSVEKLQLYFAQDMVVHHEHAVGMARKLLTFSKQPGLVDMAADIITSQSAEIELLKSIAAQIDPNATPLPSVDHSGH